RGWTPRRSSARAAPTWRAGRGRRESSGPAWSFALDRAGQLLDPAAEEAERRGVGDGIFGEGGLLGRHLDRIAVEAGHDRDAVAGRAIDRRAVGRAAQLRVERGGEVDVARLVPRRSRIGDVRSEHAHALRPDLQRRAVNAEKALAHDSPPDVFGPDGAKSVPTLRSEPVCRETQADGGKRLPEAANVRRGLN